MWDLRSMSCDWTLLTPGPPRMSWSHFLFLSLLPIFFLTPSLMSDTRRQFLWSFCPWLFISMVKWLLIEPPGISMGVRGSWKKVDELTWELWAVGMQKGNVSESYIVNKKWTRLYIQVGQRMERKSWNFPDWQYPLTRLKPSSHLPPFQTPRAYFIIC